MATCGQSTTYTNIVDLPQVTNIEEGDLLIVQTVGGTSIIDFSDFIITAENTTFGDVLSSNTTNIAILSSQVSSLSASVLSSNTALTNTVNTSITSLSSQIVNYNTFATFNITTSSATLLNSSNVSNITFNNATSAVTINFKNNFKDTFYCVSLNTYSPVNTRLVITDLQTNFITVCAVDALNKPSVITRGWVQIVTV